MKNVTISMDEETARWVRVQAARNDESVSRFIAKVLMKERERGDSYERAMADALAQEPFLTFFPGGRIPTREEMHERPGLR